MAWVVALRYELKGTKIVHQIIKRNLDFKYDN